MDKEKNQTVNEFSFVFKSIILFLIISFLPSCKTLTKNAELPTNNQSCVSIPPEKFAACGCSPAVRVAIDIFAASKLPENVQASLEECLTGNDDVSMNILKKDIMNLRVSLNNCVSRKTNTSERIVSVIASIADKITNQTPSKEEVCNWNKCFYGSDAICADVPVNNISAKIIEKAKSLRNEYNGVINAHKPPYMENEFSRVEDHIKIIKDMDQNNGHVYYFSGEVMRVLNKLDESQNFFYQYIELNESQSKDQRSDSILFVACYENSKGFCRQRTGRGAHKKRSSCTCFYP